MDTRDASQLAAVRAAGFAFTPTLVEVGDGEWLSVVDVGRGHPIIFSHGTPTWSYDWRKMIEHLGPRFRCIAPDHFGFGLSPRPPRADYSPEAHAARFRRLVDGFGFDRYSLVVHDFGGPIALDSALDQPERVASLVVINSFAWPFADMGRVTEVQARVAGSGLARWLYRRVNLSFLIAASAWGDRATKDPATWALHRSLFPSADEREQVLFALARSLSGSQRFFTRLWERRERFSNTPVHLVWGLQDSALPAAFLRRFQTAWPHASVLSLPTAGHWPFEEQPEECVRSVNAFLCSAADRAGNLARPDANG